MVNKQRLAVIASLEGVNGEQIMAHKVEEDQVLITVENTREWCRLHYEVVEDGTYNQSVKNIKLPYIVVNDNVYSIDDFHDWKK